VGTQPFTLFAKVITKRADEMAKSAGEIVAVAARAIGEDVATETPVDTGVARSNWIMSIDAPTGEVIPAYVPYPRTHQQHRIGEYKHQAATGQEYGFGRKEERANLAAVLAQHEAAVASFDPERNNAIYLCNNVDYIRRLNNEGYSPQTEAFFVQRAVQKGITKIRSMKLLKAA